MTLVNDNDSDDDDTGDNDNNNDKPTWWNRRSKRILDPKLWPQTEIFPWNNGFLVLKISSILVISDLTASSIVCQTEKVLCH